MAFDLLLAPRSFRQVDLALVAARAVALVALAARLFGALLAGEPVQHGALDAGLLLGPVVAGTLLRSLWLWPRAVTRSELPAERGVRVASWPAPVMRVGGLEVCAAEQDALGALGPVTWWGRYRTVVLQHGLHGALGRALVAAAAVLALTVPIFLLAQSIEFGAPLGQWDGAGPAAWLRALLRTALSVGISAAVWWALLAVGVHLVWALGCLRRSPSPWQVLFPLWVARAAWLAAPLGLLLRQVL